MSEYQLALEIIKRSVNPTWEMAKREWKLVEIEESEDYETCLCGHYPIRELCTLKNIKNGKKTIVGNCCVKKFLGLPSNKIFQAVKRVRKDTGKSLNAETIRLAYEQGWINDWENNFYLDIMRKRMLTNRQLAKKLQVNEKVLRRVRTTSRAVG